MHEAVELIGDESPRGSRDAGAQQCGGRGAQGRDARRVGSLGVKEIKLGADPSATWKAVTGESAEEVRTERKADVPPSPQER